MGKRILVIEDGPVVARLIQHTLTKHGYEVLTAVNGLEGLRRARKDGPDLIMLDVMLPGIDGFETCHRLRAESPGNGVPIIMLSGKARDADKATSLKVGANEYLVKPVSPSKLVGVVGDFLQGTSRSHGRLGTRGRPGSLPAGQHS